MEDTTKILAAVFVSKVRIKALRYFLLNPDKRIHLRGSVRRFDEEINAVRRELNRLVEVEILTAQKEGNRKYYKLNKDNLLVDDLAGIFHKVFGLGGAIIRNSDRIGSIKYALLTDSYLNGNEINGQMIDLIVVGDVNLARLGKVIQEAESNLDREIHYTVMTEREFYLKKKRRDPFLVAAIIGNKSLLIGDINELIA